MEDDKNDRTLFCGNLCDQITEELLYELFIQAGPVERVSIPVKDGKPRSFGFITFKHAESIQYAIQLMSGICLFRRELRLNARESSNNNSPNLNRTPFSFPPNPLHNRSLTCPNEFQGRRDRRNLDNMEPQSRKRTVHQSDDSESSRYNGRPYRPQDRYSNGSIYQSPNLRNSPHRQGRPVGNDPRNELIEQQLQILQAQQRISDKGFHSPGSWQRHPRGWM